MKSALLIVARPIKNEVYVNSLPPMGVLSIATFLRKNNFDAEVIDCNIEDADKFDIKEFNLIGFSVMISNVENTLKMAKKVKTDFPEKRVAVGGPHVNSNPGFFIKKEFIDIVVVGEGELTVLEIMQDKEMAEIKGIYYKDGNGKIAFSGARDRIKNLDMLPFPDLGLVDYHKYDSPFKKKKPISSIMTSRGCPYLCTFCFRSLGRVWVPRSPKNVVDEIEYQVTNFGINEICIEDDNFTLNVKRANEICDLIIQRGTKVKLQFPNGVRVDRLDEDLLQKLKDVGVWIVSVAPESGSQESLKKIEKKLNLDQVEEVVSWCHKIGLNTRSFFMVGFPWETRDNIQQTIDFALHLDTDLMQLSRVIPLPGTKLFEQMGLENNEGFGKERGMFYGSVEHNVEGASKEEIHKMIKKGYRTFYLNPNKIWRLYRMLTIADIYKLLKFSITSESF